MRGARSRATGELHRGGAHQVGAQVQLGRADGHRGLLPDPAHGRGDQEGREDGALRALRLWQAGAHVLQPVGLRQGAEAAAPAWQLPEAAGRPSPGSRTASGRTGWWGRPAATAPASAGWCRPRRASRPGCCRAAAAGRAACRGTRSRRPRAGSRRAPPPLPFPWRAAHASSLHWVRCSSAAKHAVQCSLKTDLSGRMPGALLLGATGAC